MRALMILLMLTTFAHATTPVSEVANTLGKPKLQGETTARLVAFPLYEAELWVPEGQSFPNAGRFALTLRYKYNFGAGLLAEASVREIARMEGKSVDALAPLRAKLQQCFTDVTPVDRITGVSEGANAASFYFNGRKLCSITHPNFRESFFNIWLGPKTRDPKGRSRLTGKG